MERRMMGASGLEVSVLSFGTLTFNSGGVGQWDKFGSSDLAMATRIVDVCVDEGINLFDTADVYSRGQSEEILGKALGRKRDQVLIATKAFHRMGDGVHDLGASRTHLVRACEDSLRRLGTDYLDLYQLHEFDAMTPVEETLRALDDLVRSGKVRYIGCSNYAGWQLMKCLATSDAHGLHRFVSHQVCYSMAVRETEQEIVPLALDQGVGLLAYSPLAGGLLSGQYGSGRPFPDTNRGKMVANSRFRALSWERVYEITDELERIAGERGVTVAQVALNYMLGKAGVCSLILGASSEEQLRSNIAATSWELAPQERAALDGVSRIRLAYPYWHQAYVAEGRNPYYRENGLLEFPEHHIP